MGIQAQESVPPLSEYPVASDDTEETEDFLRAWKFALYSLTSENVLQLFKPTLSPFFCTSLMICYSLFLRIQPPWLYITIWHWPSGELGRAPRHGCRIQARPRGIHKHPSTQNSLFSLQRSFQIYGSKKPWTLSVTLIGTVFTCQTK